jgi:predicted kinase
MIVYIMHGLPGSGKSTLARQLVGLAGLVASTDDWHTDAEGRYNYRAECASTAHAWNQRRVRSAVLARVPRIAVDNTNVSPDQWEPYETFAKANGYTVEHKWVHPNLTNEELAARTVHAVPVEVIAAMRAKLERNLSHCLTVS